MVLPHNIYYYYLNLEHVLEVLKMLLARKLNMISSDQVLCFSKLGKGENKSEQVLYFLIEAHSWISLIVAFHKYFSCQVEYSIAELLLTLTQPGFYCSTRHFVRWNFSLIFKRKNKNYPSAKCENVAELAVQLRLTVQCQTRDDYFSDCSKTNSYR